MIIIESNQVYSTDGLLICRAAQPKAVFTRSIVRSGETVDDFLEVDAPPAPLPYTKRQYSAEVERLIARRYSHGQEIQLLVEKDADPQAYADYRAYVEQCKLTATENLTARAEEDFI